MADDVIKSFPGVTRMDKGARAQPAAAVVEFLEGLVAEAKRGDIQAVAVAYVRPDDVVGEGWQSAEHSTSHHLFAAISDLWLAFGRGRHEHNNVVIPTIDPNNDKGG